MENFPELKSKRFVLRQFVESDIHNVFKALSNPEVIKYYGVNYLSLEATKEQMEWFANIRKEKTGIWWAICDRETQAFCGGIGFSSLTTQHSKAEIGFWLLPEFWGKGVAQEAAKTAIHYAFEELNLHRIEAFVETENVNCTNLMKKLNFVHEGTMRECEIKNDNFTSLAIYSFLKKDYCKNQPA